MELVQGVAAIAAVTFAQGSTMQTHAGPRFGDCVRVGDDVDGDQVADVWVTSGRDVRFGLAAVYAFSGADGDVLHEIELCDGEPTHRAEPFDDVDGDGIRDVLVFARERVRLRAGRSGRPLDWSASYPTYALGDVIVTDDVNGDGVRDVWFGSPEVPPELDGRREAALLLSGRDGTEIRRVHEPFARDDASFGRGLALVGDQDGDGTRDLLVGAPSRGGGSVYVISGRDGVALGRVAGRDSACSVFGWPIVGLGDVDGDGVEDWAAGSVAVGCWSWDDGEPSYVTAISGRTRAELWTLERVDVTTTFGHALLRVGATDLAIGFPSSYHDDAGVVIVDARDGRLDRRWPRAAAGLGADEVLGSSLASLVGAGRARSAVAVGGAVQIDDWNVYSGLVAVFESSGTLRWARAARELYRDPDERCSGPRLSPPLFRARFSSSTSPNER